MCEWLHEWVNVRQYCKALCFLWPLVTKKQDTVNLQFKKLIQKPEMTETPLEFRTPLETQAFVSLHKCDAVYFIAVKNSYTVTYLECLPSPIQK